MGVHCNCSCRNVKNQDRNQIDLQEFAEKFLTEKEEPVEVVKPRLRSASCQKVIRKSPNLSQDSMIIPQDEIEMQAQKFAEMYRLAVIEQLPDLKNLPDIDMHLKNVQEEIKGQMGLQTQQDRLKLNDYLVNLREQSSSGSGKAVVILNSVQRSIIYFKQHGRLERAISLMNLSKHDCGRVTDKVYLTIWSKIYAEIRYQTYQKIRSMADMKRKEKDHLSGSTQISQWLILSSRDAFSSQLLTPDEIQDAMQSGIDVLGIMKKTLDLFKVDYQYVDNDVALVMKKLDYEFTCIPPFTEEKKRIQFEMQVLKESHLYMMEFIKDYRNIYPDMNNSPLESQNIWYGTPDGFKEIQSTVRQNMQKENSQSQKKRSWRRPITTTSDASYKGFESTSSIQLNCTVEDNESGARYQI